MKALSIAQSPLTMNRRIMPPTSKKSTLWPMFCNALNSEKAAKLSKDAPPGFATYTMFHLVKEQIIKQLEAC
jgi:hypothetical protein